MWVHVSEGSKHPFRWTEGAISLCVLPMPDRTRLFADDLAYQVEIDFRYPSVG